ncbi:Ubiquinone/menaquinone biosynthesis C-methyltransferase UbiE [Paraliobacillus sp. PM-2]|uniref:class I SAM-dependent methyltransferase n=1 Tax=Paraliobacillus sp. PM-2 TaxID=1462524 RepID=UPI00061CAE90|nr:class I SAM-dependent methyltransferase [Paraliobacillus sp. PM-2]CQR46004.1 Ubiquinone/menaquinone biosynthesis C-methyltransferase UbiE [Paraliobacillus sp. PM-2]
MNVSYTDMIATFGIGGAHPGGLSATKYIMDQLQLKPEEPILDVGCGTGQTLDYLAKNLPNPLFGVDQHQGMLTKAKKRLETHPTVTLKKANIENLPFTDNFFGFILSESVTAFTPIDQALQEYARTLKKNGTLILLEMTTNDILKQEQQAEIKQFYHIPKLLTEEMWCAAINQAGFQTVSAEVIPDKLENIIDFDLQTAISQEHFELMATHYQLTEKYKDLLSARLYYCKKE